MVALRQVVPVDALVPETATVPTLNAHPVTPTQSSLLKSNAAASAPVEERTLTSSQVESIRSAMRLFVEDDLARGAPVSGRVYCDACERPRPAAGFITYDRYALCNLCAIEYEVARARRTITTPGQYVRAKHFGDGDLFALPD